MSFPAVPNVLEGDAFAEQFISARTGLGTAGAHAY